MANGYKIVIRHWYDRGHWREHAQPFARALAGAMRYLGAALVHSYRFHRPEPPFVFLELNQLYRLARHHGLLESAAGGGDDAVNLATLYTAICMLALVDPFGAEEGRVDSWFACLPAYARLARIVPGGQWEGTPEGLYFLDLASDTRPRHCVFLEPPVQGEDPHILDARPALKEMHAALAAASPGRRRTLAEAAIMRGLLPEVTPRDKRRSERHADQRWIEVAVGLAQVCRQLSQREKGEAAQAVRWQVRDVSNEGYRLAMDAHTESFPQVGDLLCVLDDSEHSDAGMQLLVVRWLRDDREQGVELGVERLDGTAAPVSVSMAADAEPEFHAALFLSSTGSEASMARLVAPAETFGEQRPLLLRVGEREIRVVCGRCIESGPGFDCFEFSAAG
jgi:hypothetical protein